MALLEAFGGVEVSLPSLPLPVANLPLSQGLPHWTHSIMILTRKSLPEVSQLELSRADWRTTR